MLLVISAVLDTVDCALFLRIVPEIFFLPFHCSFLLYLLGFSFSICPLNGDTPYGFVCVSSHLKLNILLGKKCPLQDFTFIHITVILKSLSFVQVLPLSAWAHLNFMCSRHLKLSLCSTTLVMSSSNLLLLLYSLLGNDRHLEIILLKF